MNFSKKRIFSKLRNEPKVNIYISYEKGLNSAIIKIVPLNIAKYQKKDDNRIMREIDKILLHIEEHIKSGTYSPMETDKIELKDLSGGTEWKELHKTTCAFLNTKGGIAVIGIKEDTKQNQFKFTGYNPNNESNIKTLPTLFTDDEGRNIDLTEYIRPDLIEVKQFLTGQICLVFIEKLPDEFKYVFYNREAYERRITGDHRIPDEKFKNKKNSNRN